MRAFVLCLVLVLCAYSFIGVQGCGSSKRRTTYSGWDTKFRHGFKMECKESGQSIYNVQSAHSDKHEDRVWGYYCRSNPYISTSCRWSLPNGQFVNNFDGKVNFICPGNGNMVGIFAGPHDRHYNDRRFDFKCCDAALQRINCKWTAFVNNWDGNMNYNVPSGYYLTGAYSEHHDHYEDRKWKFYICQ